MGGRLNTGSLRVLVLYYEKEVDLLLPCGSGDLATRTEQAYTISVRANSQRTGTSKVVGMFAPKMLFFLFWPSFCCAEVVWGWWSGGFLEGEGGVGKEGKRLLTRVKVFFWRRRR